MKTGAQLIAEERERQISQEGWTAENDDANDHQEMSRAALVYIRAAHLRISNEKYGFNADDAIEGLRSEWPRQWDKSWYKPTSSIRDLTKSGALIAAEIDRLQRKMQAECDDKQAAFEGENPYTPTFTSFCD